jgi:pectate lyase
VASQLNEANPRRTAILSAVAMTIGTLAVTQLTANAADASTAVADTGWATQANGTTGGSAAVPAQIYTVSTKSQLTAALVGTDPATGKTNKKAPKIIKWAGTIDMTEGKPYTDTATRRTVERSSSSRTRRSSA